MRRLILLALSVVVGCGGGGSGKSTDPDSLDFCLRWANGVCRLAYLCVDTPMQDAAFHARYGTSAETCFQTLEGRCLSNQSGAQAFGPSCGPGKTVNQTAGMTCGDNLDSLSCIDWTANPGGGCDGVCGATSNRDASSGSDTGAGSDAGTGGVGTAAAFCVSEGELLCERQFECDPAGSAMDFGNLAGCKGSIDALCAIGDPCPNGYDPALAAGCMAATRAATCTALAGPTPTICTSACN